MTDLAAYVKQHKASRIAYFGMLHLFPDCIVKSPGRLDKLTTPLNQQQTLAPEWSPLTGVTAEVQQTGGVSSRGTLSRAMVPGWQKKIDTREAALVISGPTFYWRIPVDGKSGATVAAAHAFATAVNDIARRQQQHP